MQEIYEKVRLFALAIPFIKKNLMRPYLFFNGNVASLDMKGLTIVTAENYEEVVNKMTDRFVEFARKDEDPLSALMAFTTKPYRLQLLSFIQYDIDRKKLGELLSWAWTQTEFPHQYSIQMLIELFERADKDALMNEEEKKILSGLDEQVIVYRGTQSNKAKKRGLSWTTSQAKAGWFAERWKTKQGKVYKATISKRDVFAYFGGRSEQEIVLNPRKLKNIKEINNCK